MRWIGSRMRALRGRLRRGGAGESGFAGLLELCFVNACGDTLVTVALANTIFFANPGGARSRTLLYLVVTMVPFALLAPLIGPLLDRLGRGRRLALAVTMLARAGLCLTLATHGSDTVVLFPAALGVLVTSRAFGLAKSAVVPRVLPAGGTLVAANARLSFAGVVAALLVAPIGEGLTVATGTYAWALRLAAFIFAAAVLISFTLPAHVDSAEGETAAVGLGLTTRRGRSQLPTALRTTSASRALVGFVTFFLAFALRGPGGHGKGSLAALAVAAGLGTALGVGVGGRLSRRRPELLITAGLLLSSVACVVGALFYSRVTGLAVALAATLAGSMAKLAWDALLQRDVPEPYRASAFARSETTLQLAWVAGGVVGLLPVSGTIGFALAAAAMCLALLAEVSSVRLGRALPAGRRGASGSPAAGAAPAPSAADATTVAGTRVPGPGPAAPAPGGTPAAAHPDSPELPFWLR